MTENIAISVKNISKTFYIPHEKVTSVKGAVVNAFKRGSYEKFKALDDVSFEIKKGEFFGIIGRNGSGKSTLLKVLACIYQADQGKVKINGMISPFLELGIGFNPELSGRDNIYLNATVLGMTKKQIDEKFDSIVKFSELERFIDQKLKNYSSGMQVRLAFSVSIHANRDILLMDEVLAVGDSNFQSKCLEEFNKYREMGRTVVIVTHDIAVVQKYCDRAMLIKNGKIKKIGKSEDVVNEYVYDNIYDEEIRMTNEQNLKNEYVDRRKNETAEIMGVEFLDKNGTSKNVFKTGEDIKIKVSNQFYKNINDPIFGIIIKDTLYKNSIFVLNTQFEKMSTGTFEVGEGNVVYSIKNIFATGEFYVSLAIADSTGKIFYDWKECVRKFKVVNSKYDSGGIVDLGNEIIISKSKK